MRICELLEKSQNSVILVGRVTAKVIFYVKTDVEGRSLGQRLGFVTLVVLGDNYECHRLEFNLVYK